MSRSFWRLGMSTLVSSEAKFQRAYVPTSALAKSVRFDEGMMHVSLTDGRVVSVPVIWFPLLRDATPKQRERYEIGGGGDRKSTRLNSSHLVTSYAVFCLKK